MLEIEAGEEVSIMSESAFADSLEDFAGFGILFFCFLLGAGAFAM